MDELSVTYSELKTTTDRMFILVRRTLGVNEKLTLKKAFYEDLGVIELDWDSFLVEYENEFKCQLEGLNYDDYFEQPAKLTDFLIFPLRLLGYPLLLLPDRYLRRLKNFLYPSRKTENRLTIGDLVLSAIAKKFVKREQTTIRIKYAC